jgi:hypothetical protein
MLALWIIGGLVLLCFLLSLLRVGVIAEYGGETALLRLRIGWFRFRLLTGKEEDEEAGQAPQEAKKTSHKAGGGFKSLSKSARQFGGSINRLRGLLPIVTEGIGRIHQTLTVDLLHLEYISGGPDPAKAAIGFGRASAVFGIFLPVLENTFHIKKKILRAGVDYHSNESSIYLKTSLSMHLFQIVSLAIWFGRQYVKQKKAVEKGAVSAKNEGS